MKQEKIIIKRIDYLDGGNDIHKGLEQAERMENMRLMHNMLSHDFLYMVNIAKMCPVKDHSPMTRACFSSLFTLIEATISAYIAYHPDPKFKEWDSFEKHFKGTFKHHGNTFDRKGLVSDFQDKNYQLLLKVRKQRDGFTHPKNMGMLKVNEQDLDEAVKVHGIFMAYFESLMKDTGLQIRVDRPNTVKK